MFCQLFERLEENGERSLCRMNEDAWISASIDEELVKQPLMESQLAESATTAKGKKDHPDEEDKDHKAPLGLLMEVKFIKALKDKDFQLAFRLCQMTLIYEPTNPEATEILPLLQQKLLEEQGTEESSEEEEEDEDDSERGERSSCMSSCSTSSSSSDNDEEDPDDSEKEKHK